MQVQIIKDIISQKHESYYNAAECKLSKPRNKPGYAEEAFNEIQNNFDNDDGAVVRAVITKAQWIHGNLRTLFPEGMHSWYHWCLQISSLLLIFSSFSLTQLKLSFFFHSLIKISCFHHSWYKLTCVPCCYAGLPHEIAAIEAKKERDAQLAAQLESQRGCAVGAPPIDAPISDCLAWIEKFKAHYLQTSGGIWSLKAGVSFNMGDLRDLYQRAEKGWGPNAGNQKQKFREFCVVLQNLGDSMQKAW